MTPEPAAGAAPDDGLRRLVILITIPALVLFWLIVTSWRPWDLLDRAGFSADFYDEQARVFLRGGLAVDPQVADFEGFDVRGKTYLYYGPFLAVVRMPLMLFGDLFVGRLVRISMLLALATSIHWSARLALAARGVVRSAGDTPSGRWGIGLFVGAVAFSPALFAAGWTSVYHETELWALALAVITITMSVEWAAGGFTDRRRLMWAAAGALGTTLTRAPIGFGVSLVLFLCGLVLLSRSRSDGAARGDGVRALVAGIVPVAAHAAVNVAKFGTLLSVPADKQRLSIIDPERAAWFVGNNDSFFSLRFLPTTLAQYLRPDTIRFERLVPGVRYGPLAPDYGSYPVETVTPSSSLTVSAALLVLFAVIGAAWLVRRRARMWLLVVGATALGALPTFLIGFVANRYLIDMLPPLIAAGAVGAAALATIDTSRTLKIGGAVLVVWGAWVNAALATWTLELKSPGFTELRYEIDDAVFGGGHPSLVTLDPSAPVPRDGVVGVLADCSGVYIAEQGRWVALERADGAREVSGAVDEASQVLAAGATWTLRLDAGPAGRVLVLDAGPASFERPLDAMAGDRFEVIVDDIMGVFVATVADTAVFISPDAVRQGGADIRPNQSPAAPTSSLCESLTD